MSRAISIVISSILLSATLSFVFATMSKAKDKARKKMTDDKFTVALPKMVATIGAIGDVVFSIVVIGFTFFSKEVPHLIFYLVFGLGIWVGSYLILKTLVFRVIVSGERILVHDILKKPYEFTFSDIVSVRRKVSRNQIKSEKMIVKTNTGKKLVLDSAEESYDRFLNRIKSGVSAEYLKGFDI